MTDRKLALLAIAAVILAGWAILQNRLTQRTGARGLFESAPLIQGLNVDAIAGITLTSDQGKNTLTFRQKDGRFGMAEKDNYPANISAINTLLNNCLDIRVTRPITSNPVNHADLGVTEQTARNTVRFLNAEGDEITGLLISERQTDPAGAYVRLTTDDSTYFIQDPPWISTTPTSYLNTTVIEADRSKIRQVTVRGPHGEYVLKAADGGEIVLETMPEDKQFKGTTYRSVFGALSSVRFSDVMSADNTPDDLVFDHSYVCELDDSTVYTVKLATRNDKYFATFTADFLDKAPVQVGRADTEEVLKEKEAKLLAMDAAKAFVQRHKGWVYEISSHKAQDLTKPLDELLEDKPEPVTDEADTDDSDNNSA